MKTRSQKLISLVLVLVMLVTMIPMGMFVASAEDAVLIGTPDDWTAAVRTEGIGSKTIKLTANINFEGAEISTLADTFTGTFDGQGFAIQNAVVNGNAVIANTLAGSATVQNVKFENVDVTDTTEAAGIIAGQLTGADSAVFTLSRITVDSASCVQAAGKAGGLIGFADGTNYTLNIVKVYMQANVFARVVSGGSTAWHPFAGGLIGAEGDNSTSKADVVINVTDTAVTSGPTEIKSGKVIYAGAGGILGLYTGSGTKDASSLNLKNVVVNGGQHYAVCYMYQGTVTYENLYIGTGSSADIFGANSYSSWINNERTKALGLGASPDRNYITIASITNRTAIDLPLETTIAPPVAVTADELAITVQTDADGFVTAVSQDGLAFDLMNYDSVDTFTINSVEDWNLIATSGKGFLGKTIKLGNDIDAKGGELKTLIPQERGANAFWACFDGQGHTIKHARVANALFAHTLMKGEISSGVTGAAEIKNVKLDNITVTGTDAAFIAVQYSPYQEVGAITIDGIKITNSSVTATGVAGGMYASTTHHNSAGQDGVIIKNVYMSDTVKITGATAAGGLVGQALWNSGWMTISNIETYATVETTQVTNNAYVGGLLGNAAHLHTSGTGVTVSNCIIGGLLKDASESNKSGGVGGVFGYVEAGGTKSYTMQNLIIMPKFESADRWKTLLGTFSGAPFLTVHGILSPTTYTSNPWPYVGTSGTLTINGIAKSGGEMSSIDCGAIQIVKIDPANLKNLVKRDDNGALVKVYDGVAPKAIQYSQVDAETNTYAIRFIAMSQLTTVTNLKMTVIATYTDASGNTVRRKFEKPCELYDVLSVYNAQGITDRRTAEEYGAEKLAGLTIYNIPADTEITFEVTTSYDYFTGTLTGTTVETTLTETSTNPQIFTASVDDGKLIIKY